MHKKIIIITVLFLILASFAYAKEDFTVNSKDSLNLCPCYTYSDPVLIKNTGTEPSKYRLFVDDAFSGWVEISPNNFILNPGQGAFANVYVSPPCNSEGKYDFNVYAATESGLAKGIKQTLNVLPCYDYSLYSGELYELKGDETAIVFKQHEGDYSVCAGSSVVIPVLIKNNEGVQNDYSFELTGPEFASLNVRGASLNPKQQGVVLISLNPGDGVKGDFKLTFSSISKIGEVKKKLSMEVNVDKCYDLKVEFSKDRDNVCGCEPAIYSVVIENNGKFKEDVAFELTGPEWVNANVSSAVINPKGQKEIYVTAYTDCDVSGKYALVFTATGEEVNSSGQMVLDVTPKIECYKADIIADSKITADYSGIIVPVTIENRGTKKADYNVSVDAPDWVIVTPDYLAVNPGKKGNVNLKIMPTNKTEEGTYSITINLIKDEAAYSKTIDIRLKEDIIIKNVEKWFRYYQYYFYLAFFVLAVILLLIRPVKRRIEKFKIEREKRKERGIKRKERELEREKRRIERMEQRKALKKIEAKKEIKVRINIKKWLKWLFIVLLVIVILGLIGYIIKRLGMTAVKELLIVYWLYILIGVVLLIIILLILYFTSRKKKKKGNLGKIIKIVAVALVLILAVFLVVYYKLYGYIKDFFMGYLYYIIAGVVILVILIFVLRFFYRSE